MKSRTKKRLIALALALALCAGGAVALRQFRAAQRAAGIQQARERGMAAYEAGDWHETLDQLGYYIGRAGRSDAQALYRIADARQRIPEDDNSHISLALRAAIDAEAADPTSPDARRLLLDLYIRAGRYTEALDTLERALAAEPRDRSLLERRVEILVGLRRWPEARRASLEVAAAFPKDPDAHRAHISVLLAESGDRLALDLREYLDAAAQVLDPGADLEALRADVYLSIGDNDAAWTACLHAVESGLSSGRQLAAVLDALDILAGLHGDRAEVLDLARVVEERALALNPVPEDMGVALVSRAFRLGLSPGTDRALAETIGAPSAASDRALGWAAVAGDPSAPSARALRNTLASRTTDEAAFWNAAVAAADALRAREPLAIEPARNASGLASLLPPEMSTERALAAYLLAGAEEARGAHALAEEGFAAVAAQGRWRVARAAHVSILLDRGAQQDALDALNASFGDDPGFVYTGPGLLLRCAALVGLAERSRDAAPDAAEAARYLDMIIESSGQRDALYLGLLARARAASGNVEGASIAVDQMLLLGEQLDVDVAVRTGAALRPTRPDLAERLLAEAGRRDPANADLLFEQAMSAARDGRRDEAIGILDRAIAGAQGDERTRLRVLHAQLLDALNDDGALDALSTLASEHADDLAVQQALLDSRAAWNDEGAIRIAIARVRAITGDAAHTWRLAEARRLLTFAPDGQQQQRASEALTVALEPLLRAGTDARAFDLAARAWVILGRRAEAIAALERALPIARNRSTIYPRLVALLLQAGRTDDARARLQAFLAEGEIGAVASRQRAVLLEQLEMWDDAIAQRERLAAAGLPEDALALAQLLTRAGEFEQAGWILDELLRTQPPTRELILAAARLRALTGDVDGGLAHFSRLADHIPETTRVLLIADYLRASGRLGEAREIVDAHAADPGAATDPEVWLWIARAAYEAGEVEVARAAVDRGLEASPDFAPLLVIRRLEKEGVTDPALLAAFASDDTGDRSDPVLLEFHNLAMDFATGRLTAESFEQRLAEVTAAHPQFARAWSSLIRLRLARGDTRGAASAALDATRLIPSDPRPARDAAEILAALGRLDEALAAARTWRDRTPADPKAADLYIAELHLLRGAPQEAAAVARLWETEILASPSPSPAEAGVIARVVAATAPAAEHAALLSRAASSRQWASACIGAASFVPDASQRRTWLERLNASPGLTDDDALVLASQWRGLGEITGSAEDLEIALELGESRRWSAPLDDQAALHRALTLRRLGRIEQAEQEYLGLIASSADAAAMREARGGLLLMAVEDAPQRAAGVATQVRALWDEVRADTALSAERRAATGDLVARFHLAAGNPPEAVATLDQALDILPRDPELQSRKVHVLLIAGDRDGAGEALEAIGTREGQVRAMLALGGTLAPERPADAEWLYRRAYQLNRDNFMVTNNLAYHLVTHGGDASEAVALAQQAVQSVLGRDPRPEVLGTVYETLGAALLTASRPEEAEQAFREGLRFLPEEPSLLLGLAESLVAMERRAEAQEVFSGIDESGRTALSDDLQRRYERLAAALDP